MAGRRSNERPRTWRPPVASVMRQYARPSPGMFDSAGFRTGQQGARLRSHSQRSYILFARPHSHLGRSRQESWRDDSSGELFTQSVRGGVWQSGEPRREQRMEGQWRWERERERVRETFRSKMGGGKKIRRVAKQQKREKPVARQLADLLTTAATVRESRARSSRPSTGGFPHQPSRDAGQRLTSLSRTTYTGEVGQQVKLRAANGRADQLWTDSGAPDRLEAPASPPLPGPPCLGRRFEVFPQKS